MKKFIRTNNKLNLNTLSKVLLTGLGSVLISGCDDINDECEKQFKKELEDLSTVISKIEYISASQNVSLYSSSTESINLQVPVVNIVQLIKFFPRIKKYIEQKEIK